MKYYAIRLSPEAQTDLVRIYSHIVRKSGSAVTAERYIDRVSGFLSSLNVFPERGTVRDEIREGLRIIGLNTAPASPLSWNMTMWLFAYLGQRPGVWE